ncbi:hypothetical protein [Lichenicola sp.]|uniref:hypothetical protein n=1 Tax=Lichenicola sp. TaxID=2804529 RepID=UPI003AFF6308
MQIGTILDVAIGLAVTFFLLALIASGVQEIIAGLFKWRGTYLNKSIDVLINNDPAAGFTWQGIGDWLHAHLTKGAAAPSALKAAAQDPVLSRVTERLTNHPLLHDTPNSLPSYLSAQTFAMALLDALRDGSSLPAFSQAEATIASLPAGDLKTTLTTFVHDAGGDLDRLRSSIETWFDDAMDRLSGIYKRFSQYVMLVIGSLLAVALNVDGLHLARLLWDLPVSRAALVASANDVAAHASTADPASQLQATFSALQNQPLPFGWHGAIGAQTIVGWIVTALAVSLGAPFWFGLLKNLTDLRAAGPKPARADAADSSTD